MASHLTPSSYSFYSLSSPGRLLEVASLEFTLVNFGQSLLKLCSTFMLSGNHVFSCWKKFVNESWKTNWLTASASSSMIIIIKAYGPSVPCLHRVSRFFLNVWVSEKCQVQCWGGSQIIKHCLHYDANIACYDGACVLLPMQFSFCGMHQVDMSHY